MEWNDATRIRCRLKLACPESWDGMATIGEGVRFCSGCQSPVYEVRTPAELDERTRKGQCVSVALSQLPPLRPTDLDGIVPEPRLTGKPRQVLSPVTVALVLAALAVCFAVGWLLR